MFCSKCGKEIEDNAKFCQYCGHEVGTSKIDNKIIPIPNKILDTLFIFNL